MLQDGFFLLKHFQQMTYNINPGLNMHCRREFIYVAHIYASQMSFQSLLHLWPTFSRKGTRGGDRPTAHTTKHPLLWQGELNRPITYIFDNI